jgi:hypothetical protein
LAQWQFSPPGCYPPTDPTEAILTTADIAEEFRGLVLPATAHVQPASGQALVNMPLIAYAASTATTWTPTILGRRVMIQANVASYSWDFGDGSPPLVTASAGAPYPDHTLWHTYRGTGERVVTLTTTFNGEYSLDGGRTWVDIPGTAVAVSPPLRIRVIEARTYLVG